jgi:type II secretory pathway component GspD/PulD (secretin)
VTVATHQAYVSGYEFPDDIDIAGEDADVVLTALPVVSTVPTGTTLDVQATVTGDRKYVIMTVRPQVTTLSDISTQQTPFGPVDLPIVAVQELRTTVMVPDRGTLLLGGQTLAGEVEQELGVPMVSKIPILNRLYTNRGKVRDQQTLLILIRPEIIIPEEHEKKAHPE